MKHVLATALFFILATPGPAWALKISPFKATLDVSADVPGQAFRVENNSDEPAAVQISAMTWDIAPDGTEMNTDAEKDFTVFPSQIVLKPRESRAVRVQWMGGKSGLESSRAEKPYRLIAEQLPVALAGTPGAGSAVRFLLKFKAALYVAAGPVRSDVSVSGVREDGGLLSLTLVNGGTGHAVMQNPVLTLKLSDGSEAKLSGAAARALENENMHPGRTRRFSLSIPEGARGKVVSARLDFTPSF